MSKTKLTISIVIILSIALGILSGIYFYTRKSTSGIQATSGDNSIFGGVGGVRKDMPVDNTNNVSGDNNLNRPTSTPTINVPLLRMIASGPIAGADFVIRDIIATSSQNIATTSTSSKKVKPSSKPKILGQESKIRYIERGTGRIYETSSSSPIISRITNSTYTRLYEAFFDKKGDNVLIRGLMDDSETIQTRLGTTVLDTPTSTEMSLKTKELTPNLLSLTLSPEKDYFASYIQQKGVGSSINIARLDGTGLFNVYKSPYREWLLSWPTTNTLILNTKPSAFAAGFAYSINTKTKAFQRITGGQPGLTTLVSPDGQNVLIGQTIEGSMKLGILNIKTNTYKDLYTRTLPEKCVWSKLEKNTIFCAASESIVYAPYPDAWYQGLVFFDDNIWKINTETQENKILSVVRDFAKNGLDATNLSVDANEDYLVFINKKDLSLWGLQIFKPQKTVATSTTSTTKAKKK